MAAAAIATAAVQVCQVADIKEREDVMKICEHCKKELGKLDGEGIMCECGALFLLCSTCINELGGGNCPKCKEFMIVFN